MKIKEHFLFKVLVVLLFTVINSNYVDAQNKNDRAKAYYIEALKNYNNGAFIKSLERLATTEEILNATNPKILCLKMKNHVARKDYKKAKINLDLFLKYSLNSDEVLKNEVLSYLVEIEDGIKKIKIENEEKRQLEIKKNEAKRLASIKTMEEQKKISLKKIEEQKEIGIKNNKEEAINKAIKTKALNEDLFFDNNKNLVTKDDVYYFILNRVEIENNLYHFKFSDGLNRPILDYYSNEFFYGIKNGKFIDDNQNAIFKCTSYIHEKEWIKFYEWDKFIEIFLKNNKKQVLKYYKNKVTFFYTNPDGKKLSFTGDKKETIIIYHNNTRIKKVDMKTKNKKRLIFIFNEEGDIIYKKQFNNKGELVNEESY